MLSRNYAVRVRITTGKEKYYRRYFYLQPDRVVFKTHKIKRPPTTSISSGFPKDQDPTFPAQFRMTQVVAELYKEYYTKAVGGDPNITIEIVNLPNEEGL